MSVRSRKLFCAGLLALLSAAPVAARPAWDDAEREQRRSELRQQLEAERERWRGGPVRGAPPGSYRPMPSGPSAPWAGPPADRGSPHGAGAGMHRGRGGGQDDGHRLSPEERRALRQELRQQRP